MVASSAAGTRPRCRGRARYGSAAAPLVMCLAGRPRRSSRPPGAPPATRSCAHARAPGPRCRPRVRAATTTTAVSRSSPAAAGATRRARRVRAAARARARARAAARAPDGRRRRGADTFFEATRPRARPRRSCGARRRRCCRAACGSGRERPSKSEPPVLLVGGAPARASRDRRGGRAGREPVVTGARCSARRGRFDRRGQSKARVLGEEGVVAMDPPCLVSTGLFCGMIISLWRGRTSSRAPIPRDPTAAWRVAHPRGARARRRSRRT